ncbi:hypothetical protein MSP8887_00902 [Marinomonas spartinae]|uniref:UDP-2,4-diacetamido-2,4, 6-trideoxy-beta-L-altropyranose hydrolase n=1 Tax=Marinomonas spartinae TaxID=1792290 RepID=UPI000808B330|nr:UDP-2,4-diacetamido-2,4,6-trideoxy-beta-L-altropyranose hydrolase [Marinomonas spartinae]SBS28550.1 hypothetical protein MSP8887_00902 [Marinomonas spartinae]
MKALIRADAAIEIGMGHRVRCQALASAFERLGWMCQFVVHHRYRQFASDHDLLIDCEDDLLPLAGQADLVILDHYGYQADDIARVFHSQPNLLVIDDMNDRGTFPAKWLVNPLNQAYSSQVVMPLIGGQYALLRPSFSQHYSESIPPDRLLVTLGGTDPLALTLPLLKALEKAKFSLDKVQVMLGKNARNSAEVLAYCEEKHIVCLQGVSDVTPLMRQARMAISAAGGTLFELACMGVPTVFAQVAENQTRSLEQHVPLAWCDTVRFDDVNERQRAERIEHLIRLVMIYWQDDSWLTKARQVAQRLVDGKGADRVAKTVHQEFLGMMQCH